MKLLPTTPTRKSSAKQFARQHGFTDLDTHGELHGLTGKPGKFWPARYKGEMQVSLIHGAQIELEYNPDEVNFDKVFKDAKSSLSATNTLLTSYYQSLLSPPGITEDDPSATNQKIEGPNKSFVWHYSEGKLHLPIPHVTKAIWKKMYRRAIQILNADIQQNGPLADQTIAQLSQRPLPILKT